MALAWGTIGTEGFENSVGLEAVSSFCMKAAFRNTEALAIYTSETRLLRQASAAVDKLTAPVLVTWSRFDPEFLSNRGFLHSTLGTWLGTAPASPGLDCSADAWRCVDVDSLFSSLAQKSPIEGELQKRDLPLPDDIKGIPRLELLSAGTFALAVQDLWQAGILSDDEASATLGRFFRRVQLEGRGVPQAWVAISKNSSHAKPGRRKRQRQTPNE